ncbi:MAG: ribosome biogenesis GTPase Der [Candidatus Aminicenantes bacterium]|nr:MAG: ribosome biogenesis GTPase Der [Candidatus Aminicenantes bacterium]
MMKIAIVGFPNVGKSTLFNRLLKEKKSLVHSLPGMTRDQVSAVCSLNGKKCVLIDTGGFFDTQEDPLSSQIRKKAREAAEKASLLLFVLDGKRDLLPAEKELYLSLKKLNKPIFVVVNKIDSPAEETKIGDFYRLGEEEIFAISAEHKRNLEILEQTLLDFIPSPGLDEEESQPLKIALVGRINVGKSSIVNRLCGEERLIVSEIPGTTRDSTDTLIYRDKKAFSLVDTAGIRKLSRTRDKREKASIIKAKKDISQADVICMIMDAQEFPTRQDSAIAHLSRESGKPLIIALNKWDLIEKNTRTSDDYKRKCYSKLDFVNYAPLFSVSALSGKRVIKILDLAEQVYANGKKRVGTSQLNSFLSWVNENCPPLSRKKRRIKIKYMTQKKILPPTFILFTHSQVSLAPSYEKFFTQLLREKFDFWGTPIRIVLRKN